MYVQVLYIYPYTCIWIYIFKDKLGLNDTGALPVNERRGLWRMSDLPKSSMNFEFANLHDDLPLWSCCYRIFVFLLLFLSLSLLFSVVWKFMKFILFWRTLLRQLFCSLFTYLHFTMLEDGLQQNNERSQLAWEVSVRKWWREVCIWGA